MGRMKAADAREAAAVAARKDGQTVAVFLPARDEQSTVGTIVDTIRRDLQVEVPLLLLDRPEQEQSLGVPALVLEPQAQLERLLAEEEEIERQTKERHDTPHFRDGGD